MKRTFNLFYVIVFATIILTVSIPLFAARTKVVSELYFTGLDYNDSSNKSSGWSSVFYTGFTFDDYKKFEFGVGETQISYSDGTPRLKQQDLTFVYTNTGHFIRNTTTKGSAHFIQNQEGLLDGGRAIMLDFTYYKPYPHNYGLELGYSAYNKNAAGNVVQIAPHYGKWLTSPTAKSTLYFNTKAVFIRAFHPGRAGLPNRTWASLEFSLSGMHKRLDHKVSIWGGERVYMVDGSGFTMYNIADRYVGGINLNLGYRLTPCFRVGIGDSWQAYKEQITNRSVDSSVLTLVGTYNF